MTILLPHGNPVKENINPSKVKVPEALQALREGRFSGYLRFDFHEGTGVLIFQAGRLIGARTLLSGQNLVAEQALAQVLERARQGNGRIAIYRLSPEMAAHIYDMLYGEELLRGQYLRLTDVHALLKELREMQRSCCLRVYSRERVALIFYHDGKPLGFFHDGSMSLETTVDLSQSVASEPGAKLDVLLTCKVDDELPVDLLDSLASTDKAERGLMCGAQPSSRVTGVTSNGVGLIGERRQRVFVQFQIAARQHLGRYGVFLVENELSQLDGKILGEAQLAEFFNRLAVAAKVLADPRQIEMMLDDMKRAAQEHMNESSLARAGSERLGG